MGTISKKGGDGLFNGKKLEKYLKENGITNVALAKQLGVSEGAVRHILVGIKQPSLAMANELAKMMGCTVDELIVENDE